MKVAVLIPALNPNEALLSYVDELIDAGFQNIIVIDDGSRDEYLSLIHISEPTRPY